MNQTYISLKTSYSCVLLSIFFVFPKNVLPFSSYVLYFKTCFKITYSFCAFKQHDNGKYQEIPDAFLYWFIGFFEGDGCLTVNNRQDLTFVITQHKKHILVLQQIQRTLGFGSVIRQGVNTYRYVVQNVTDLYKILLILNGNLSLPSRQQQFLLGLETLNRKLQRSQSYRWNNLQLLKPLIFEKNQL